MNTDDVAVTPVAFKEAMQEIEAKAASTSPRKREKYADALGLIADAARDAGFPSVAAHGYRAAARVHEQMATWHEEQAMLPSAPVVTIVVTTARGRERRSKRSRPTSPASDGGDAPPEPPRRSGQPVGALVHQGNSGLPSRRFLKLVAELGLPYSRVGRLVCVRAEDFYRALGLVETRDTEPSPPPSWTPDRLRLRLLKGGAR